jgi:ABC-2 type transport system permease protein
MLPRTREGSERRVVHPGTGVSPADRRHGGNASAAGVTDASPKADDVQTGETAAARDVVLRRRARAQTRVRWELLVNLVRKDLKVKYKGSTLGFAWSLANPLLLLVVYYVVFQLILPGNIPSFAVYLMSGLLIWNAFSSSVMSSCGAVLFNGGLIKKVRFPLPVLPLSAVGFAAVHFVLQLGVLMVVCVVLRYDFFGPQLLLAFPAIAVGLLWAVALSLLFSSMNVRYRDVQHLVEVGLLAWFWANPIVYSSGLIKAHLEPHGLYWAYWLNPMATVCATMQRAIYKHAYVGTGASRQLVLADPGYAFYLRYLAIAAGIGLVMLWIGRIVFRRLQADFAEEL